MDATAGSGGHSQALLDAGADRILAVDTDPHAVARLHHRFTDEPRVQVIHENFRDLARIAPTLGFGQLDGVLFDLGLSSDQLEDAARGFSFQLDGPVDMRFNPDCGRPALDLVNRLPEPELAELLRQYGDERRARRIARRIVQRRAFASTAQLAGAIRSAIPGRQRLHPATRTFQALRMATNDELGALAAGLNAAHELAASDGRVVVISFHSHEDRMVKQQFRAWAAHGEAEILTRSPHRADSAEISANRRSRSAKLRAVRMTVVN